MSGLPRRSVPRTVIAGITLLVLAAIQTEAQSPSGTVSEVLTDPDSDSELRPNGLPTSSSLPLPVAANSNIDLASLMVTEVEGSFTFTVVLHPSAGQEGLGPGAVSIQFDDNGETYLLKFNPETDLGGAAGFYSRDSATGALRLITPVPKQLSPDGLQLTAVVDRAFVLDVNGAPAFAGQKLTAFKVTAMGATISLPQNQRVDTIDEMPDGEPIGEFAVSMGLQSTGRLRLYSPSPSRASNGEATTYLFPVILANDGDKEATYSLSIDRKPANWDVRIQRTNLALAAGELAEFPVLVTLPFAHQHGGLETVRLRAEDQANPAEHAYLDLAVRFHEVPQPAGHHDQLYLHTKPSSLAAATDPLFFDAGTQIYLNTLESDPEDKQVPATAQTMATVDFYHTWDAILDPSLRMGLDFDLNRTGELKLTIAAKAPIIGELRGYIDRIKDSQALRLGNFTGIPVSIQPTQTQSYSLEFVPSQESDLVPFDGISSLVMHLVIDQGRPVTFLTSEAPQLLPGGTLSLPLNEYHDPIDPVLLEASQLKIAVKEQEKRLPPGAIGVYEYTLTNQGEENQVIALTAIGMNSAWVDVIGSREIRLGPNENYRGAIAIIVPENAANTDVANIILEASTPTGAPALARIVAIVDPSSQTNDADIYARLNQGERDTPPPPFYYLVISLAFVAIVRRRQATQGLMPRR